MWFPERIWNLSPNQPFLHLPFGIIEVANRAGAVIVPVAIEQYDKTFYVNIGAIFDVKSYVNQTADEVIYKLKAISDLRDIMATLKWQIGETLPVCRRSSLPNDYFEKFVDNRLKEWHGFTYEDMRAREFRIKDVIEPAEAFAHLKTLKPRWENAFYSGKCQNW